MRLHNAAGAIRPLATPLFGALSAILFGSLYWLIGMVATPFDGALMFAVLYGSVVAVTFGVFGIVWCVIRLLNIRKPGFARSEKQR
jgi:hypothetical protein